MKDLKSLIRTIPDFPKEGIMFRDITSLGIDADGYAQAIDELASCLDGVDFDVIAAAEARGFVFGGALAYKLNKPIVLVRKPGKLPGETVSESYDLEYGSATLQVHKDDIVPGQKVVILDDLLATGGTLLATAKLIEKLGGEVVKALALIELPALGGRDVLAKYDVSTLIEFEGD